MTGTPKRIVIPAGPFEDPLEHLIPIADFLIARGHEPFSQRTRDNSGFRPRPDGWVCELTHGFTQSDKDAVLARFELPPNIQWLGAVIRDSANWVDMYGVAAPQPPVDNSSAG